MKLIKLCVIMALGFTSPAYGEDDAQAIPTDAELEKCKNQAITPEARLWLALTTKSTLTRAEDNCASRLAKRRIIDEVDITYTEGLRGDNTFREKYPDVSNEASATLNSQTESFTNIGVAISQKIQLKANGSIIPRLGSSFETADGHYSKGILESN